MNITVKNLPETVYRVIKQEAEQQGRSLNSQIIQVLQNEAAEVQRRRDFRKARNELDKFAASLPPLDDSTPLIREDRER
ncbi:MAG: Arc family DNA-binding protein [Acidobacteriaceae bacterium]|nr:Arc family DNA-binding protein [Acidobacteriaceae bacterium]MBV9308060.1 Arc family DNA-binding protein [Acidobacteriaceae bacterium]MBV9680028.1 Arc family DNA-binding protein [Acidobacteriaceae bacterium]